MEILAEKIANQRKATRPELTECATFRELPDGMANVVVPPKIYAMATAVVEARQNRSGDVRLTYEDGTTETGRLDYDIASTDSFFKIVEDTQTAARE